MAYHTKLPIVTDGLVFSIDAYNTKSYVSGNTTTYDLTINKNNGTLQNGVGFDGTSWVFDGSDDYIDFGNPDVLNFGTNDFSVCVWFIRESNPTNNLRVFSKGAGTDLTLDPGFCLLGSDTDLKFLVNPTGVRAGANIPVVVNTPTFFVGTVNRLSSNIITYKDGIFSNIDNEGSPPLGAGTTSGPDSFWVGRNNNLSEYWDGGVYQIMIYNKVLTPSEVLQNYNALKHRFV